MNQLSYPILSTVIFLPMFGALLILITRRAWESLSKWIALATSIATFFLSLPSVLVIRQNNTQDAVC